MMTGFITTQALALALLAAPAFAANENNYTYLALGDSVAFGYDPTVTAPAPVKFTGYPEIVAEIVPAVGEHRESGSPFDVVITGRTGSADAFPTAQSQATPTEASRRLSLMETLGEPLEASGSGKTRPTPRARDRRAATRSR